MNPSTNTAQNPFKPTAAMIEAAESVFLAMAFEQSVRSIVESYQQRILQERAWCRDTDFSEDHRNKAVLCWKKSRYPIPSESVFNQSYSEVHMAQATTLQPGQIRHLLRVTASTSRHPERDCLVLLLG